MKADKEAAARRAEQDVKEYDANHGSVFKDLIDAAAKLRAAERENRELQDNNLKELYEKAEKDLRKNRVDIVDGMVAKLKELGTAEKAARDASNDFDVHSNEIDGRPSALEAMHRLGVPAV